LLFARDFYDALVKVDFAAIWSDAPPPQPHCLTRTTASPEEKFHKGSIVLIAEASALMSFKRLDNQIALLDRVGHWRGWLRIKD
jgi:hypothetical protein